MVKRPPKPWVDSVRESDQMLGKAFSKACRAFNKVFNNLGIPNRTLNSGVNSNNGMAMDNSGVDSNNSSGIHYSSLGGEHSAGRISV